MGDGARWGTIGTFSVCARGGSDEGNAEDYSVIRPALMNLKRKYPDANSDPQGIPDAVTNRNQATRNPQGERRKGL
jgi:hypothetical protein